MSDNAVIALLLWTIIGSSFFTLIGMLTVFHWVKKPDSPADESNVIARIRAWWFGLTRVDWIAKVYRAFQKDEMEVVNIVQKATNCEWAQSQTRPNHWMTECGRFHEFDHEGPQQNEMEFCQYCGNKVEVSTNEEG